MIRRLYVLLLMVLFSTAVLAAPLIPLPGRDALELLTNTSFENGLNDWIGKGIDTNKADKVKCNKPDKPVAYTGECAFMFRPNLDNSTSKITYKVTNTQLITDSAEMIFSSYIDSRGTSAGQVFGKAVIKFSNDEKLKFSLETPAATSGYTQVNHTQYIYFPPNAAIASAKVNLQAVSGKIYVDDVSLNVSSHLFVTPTLSDEWTLVWADEFEDSEINLDNWTFDIGGHGWGNNELQYYTDRPENARIENGRLVIEAREEAYEGRDYTSARLKTQGLQAWTYGRIEAQIKLPFGQGMWPAFWMLGIDIEEVGWPNCGEIDIMEFIGSDPFNIYGTIHGPGYSGADGIGGGMTIAQPFSDEFHQFAVEWEPDEIRWYMDGVRFYTASAEHIPEWVFDHDFFIILNIAVGGDWPGSPDETTTFPQFMQVEYVRVYQH